MPTGWVRDPFSQLKVVNVPGGDVLLGFPDCIQIRFFSKVGLEAAGET